MVSDCKELLQISSTAEGILTLAETYMHGSREGDVDQHREFGGVGVW